MCVSAAVRRCGACADERGLHHLNEFDNLFETRPERVFLLIVASHGSFSAVLICPRPGGPSHPPWANLDPSQ
jgi:hypothetical protein